MPCRTPTAVCILADHVDDGLACSVFEQRCEGTEQWIESNRNLGNLKLQQVQRQVIQLRLMVRYLGCSCCNF